MSHSSYFNPGALASTDWLASNLDDPSIRVIEVDEDTEAYGRGHLAGRSRGIGPPISTTRFGATTWTGRACPLSWPRPAWIGTPP
jgi:hypothetical protein